MLHDTLDTRNIWCDLLYERNNAISNADHSPCTAYGLSFALQPRHTAPDLDGGGPRRGGMPHVRIYNLEVGMADEVTSISTDH